MDKRYAGAMPTGTHACPFTTIADGLKAAAGLNGMITVHVAGSSPALVYMESSSLAVASNVVLQGAGPNQTTISASGTCGNVSLLCAVMLAAGATIDGFTVTSTGGDGIVAQAGNAAPVISNVSANGSKGNGILALGSVEIGPNSSASGNGSAGVESPQGAAGVLHVVGTGNAFDKNAGNGIDVNGTAALNFEGGTASGNFQGIRLAGVAASGGTAVTHTITSLVAQNNTGPGGVVAYNGQTIKMRSSTLTNNTVVGLFYNYVNGSTLDIGTAVSPGNNVFGGATSRNGGAGLRLCGVTGAASQDAEGDSWGNCPPTQTFLACDTAITTYSDVVYAPALTAGAPVVAATCTVGP